MTPEEAAAAALQGLKNRFKCPECEKIQELGERSDYEGWCLNCQFRMLNKGLATGLAFKKFEKDHGPEPPRWRWLKFRRYIRDEMYFLLGYTAHYDWIEEREPRKTWR